MSSFFRCWVTASFLIPILFSCRGHEGASAGQRKGALSSCIASATDAEINAALNGPSAEAILCAGSVFALTQPVRFTAPGQHLYTEGLPTDDTRAILRIAGAALTKAIEAKDRSGIAIQSIQVDGGRGALGYLAGEALIEAGGNAQDQTIRNIVAYDTRSWSTIHLFEGRVSADIPECQRITISDNAFGPAGFPDGHWADGISLACGNSTVTNNMITDATDGAIVVFGAPGSIVQNNTIVAATRTLLGGINMVDYGPVNGNYVGTVVSNNTIDARSAFIKVGIAMGPDVWSCPHTVNRGGTVTGNTLQGSHLGYGYAVNGVADWTVSGNVDVARHVGQVHGGCGGTPSAPGAFQVQAAASSALQSEFSPATLTYVLGVSEPGVLLVIRPPAACGVLHGDEGLLPGQSASSCDGRFTLTLQGDGDLALYQGATWLWSAGTGGLASAEALMQGDGNFVVYDPAAAPLWTSNSAGYPGARLAIQDDGNLVVYDTAGLVRWTSNTGGH